MTLTELAARLYLNSKKLQKLDKTITSRQKAEERLIDRLKDSPEEKRHTKRLYRVQTNVRQLEAEKAALVKSMEQDAEEFQEILERY